MKQTEDNARKRLSLVKMIMQKYPIEINRMFQYYEHYTLLILKFDLNIDPKTRSLNKLIELTNNFFNTDLIDCSTHNRKTDNKIPRFFYYKFSYDNKKSFNASTTNIAGKLMQDHTTLYNAKKTLGDIIDSESAMKESYRKYCNFVNANI